MITDNINIDLLNCIPQEVFNQKKKAKGFTPQRIKNIDSDEGLGSTIEVMKRWYPNILNKYEFTQIEQICERLFNQLKLDLSVGPKQINKLIKEISSTPTDSQEPNFKQLHLALSLLIKEQKALEIFEQTNKSGLEELAIREKLHDIGVGQYLKREEQSMNVFLVYPSFELNHPDSIALFIEFIKFIVKTENSTLTFDFTMDFKERHRSLLEKVMYSEHAESRAIANCGLQSLNLNKVCIVSTEKANVLNLNVEELELRIRTTDFSAEEEMMRKLTPAYTALLTMSCSINLCLKRLLRQSEDLFETSYKMKKSREIKMKCFSLIQEKIQVHQQLYSRLHKILLDSINKAHSSAQGGLKRIYLKGLITPIETKKKESSQLKIVSTPLILDIPGDKKKTKEKKNIIVNTYEEDSDCLNTTLSQEFLRVDSAPVKISNTGSIDSEIAIESLFKPYEPNKSYSSVSYTWHVRRWLTIHAKELPLVQPIFPEYTNFSLKYQKKMVIKHGFSRLIDPLIFDKKYVYDFGRQKCLITLIQYPDNKMETGTISFIFNEAEECIHRFHNIKGPFSLGAISQYYNTLVKETKRTWKEEQATLQSEQGFDEEEFTPVGDCLFVHQLHGYAQLEDNKNKIKIIILPKNEQLNNLVRTHSL